MMCKPDSVVYSAECDCGRTIRQETEPTRQDVHGPDERRIRCAGCRSIVICEIVSPNAGEEVGA